MFHDLSLHSCFSVESSFIVAFANNCFHLSTFIQRFETINRLQPSKKIYVIRGKKSSITPYTNITSVKLKQVTAFSKKI